MTVAVRYYTRGGNTKKVADAIADALGLTAEDVSVPLATRTDLVFLGSSYYAFDVDPAVKDFIMENKDNIGKIVCFGTSAMMKSMVKPVTKAAKAAGVAVEARDFHCRGQFGKVHKGHPDEEDLARAVEFARLYL